MVEVPISPQTSRALKKLAIEAGAPLKSVLLAAHMKAMSIATGETDVVTGLVANGRPERQDADRSLGLYLNTLPFRLRLVPGSWIELVRRTFAVERGLIPHRRYPLAEMQRLHGGPLFETAFNFTHFHVFEEAGAGARVLSQRMFEATDFKLAANFMLDVPTRAVRLELTVADPQLSDAQVEEIAGYYERALIEMAREPAADCVATSLLSPGERRRLLAEWNATESAFPAGCIHELFEREAARCPEAMAVVCGTDRLTYRELDERSNQLARHLRDLGVAPEVRVGLCVNRSVEMVVGMLGVLKAGGAYVPLEPGHPPERLAFLLANAAAPVLLTQHRLTSKTSAYQGRTVCLDTQWEQISARSSRRLSSTANSRNCAYVVYTSGSTGTPKGVVVEHGGLVNVADWHVRTFAVGPQVRMTQLASLGFDMAAWDIWSALIAGACLVVADDDTRAIPERLVEWLKEQRIVNAFLPTPLAEAVLELTWPSDTTLRVLQTAGDRLHRHPRAGLPFEVFNLYGPTEATLVATNVRLEPGLPGEPSIGRPIANTRTYVLDGNGELLPVGVVGELCIGGVGVARGYLDRPVLTAERFVPDPFHPEGRLYRTGDRCRWLADGTLQYIGRSDHQVKIRGVRIEPGEIESALAAHSAVREAVVVAREDAPGDKRLVAYLVPRADVAFSMRELRKHLESKLPEAMIPAAFVEMNALPLTANGKIDRKALPRPEAPRKTFDSGSAFDPLEIEILRMWQDVLGVTEIGTREEFFALGGHSLLAVRLLKQIEDRFRRRVPLSIFLRSPTVEGLAAALRGQASQMPWSPLVPIRSQGSRLPFFCVHPGLGNIAGYDTLARYLATDQPFYALCSIGLESDQEPDTRVEDMAARYVEAVRAVQPEGPYWLGGHSFGGLVAFEMARQLADQGERIDLLALFDTAAPGSFPGAESDRDALAIFLLFQEAALEVDYEYLRRFAPEKQLQSYFEAMVRAGQIPRGYDLEQVRRMVDWRTRIVPGAYRSYSRFYPGRATASELGSPPPPGVVDPGRGLEPVQRWKSAPVASATFHDVPGNHFTMIKQPHVRALAERLRGCLAEVDNAIPSKAGFANCRSPDHEESIAG